MADILKVTTPLVNRSQVVDPKRNIQNLPQFNLSDISKVKQPAKQGELLGQNNGLLKDTKTTSLLLDMLKDPSATTHYLKGISMLQEVSRILPANNTALTGEIEELFNELMLAPEDVLEELLLQGESASKFQGELFDLLRNLLAGNPGDHQTTQNVADVLKALSLYLTRQDALDAVANGLEYLAKEMRTSKALSEKLLFLSAKFRTADAGSNFDELKKEVLDIFKDVEDSILFSEKLAKTLSMTTYNLSRYNGDTEYLQEAIDKLLLQLPSDEQRQEFLDSVMQFLSQPPKEAAQQSRVLHVLTALIAKHTQSEELMQQGGDRISKIIQSLLSSPSNFTPLLHYILPVQHGDTQSFLEMWVNPNGEEDEGGAGSEKENLHMLLVFDIDDIGRFEMELFVRGSVIDMALMCPSAFTPIYASIKDQISQSVQHSQYTFGEIRIEDLARPRSLIEVFRSLPYKRAGVDVTI